MSVVTLVVIAGLLLAAIFVVLRLLGAKRGPKLRPHVPGIDPQKKSWWRVQSLALGRGTVGPDFEPCVGGSR